MDTIETTNTAIGAAIGGGFNAGRILVDGRPYLVIVAPKAEGFFAEVRWSSNTKRVKGAESFFDGLANTRAMAEAGSAIAKNVLALAIGGHTDWYIPSRDELELCYRAFKPTNDANWIHRNGDNPSSVPPGYPYTEKSPAQTANEVFHEAGAEAFPAEWHWTSTQYAGDAGCAWLQNFVDGYQLNGARKGYEYFVRAVRRVAL